ncbi:Splicing factor 3B subunit 1 [Frankliniella fusca]|uniref:Splicing factor 3B subunit 1 n=1 Tax=Frankliniella fusca TaxID=407009 RepID=A0AAE1H6B3_9NEOP|nr:Splicing factor 3B subunit 1 [Frankliniella fusca]
MQATLATASPADRGGAWVKRDGSPNFRKSVQLPGGGQADGHYNPSEGHSSTGHLQPGKFGIGSTSPGRQGQPSTGGEASTSKKKKGGKGK